MTDKNIALIEKWTFTEDMAQTIASLSVNGFYNASETTSNGNLLEATFFNKDGVMIMISYRHANIEKPVRDLGNRFAQEGLDRCVCGSKYWENDRCVDCKTHVLVHRARIVVGD